MKGAPSPKIDHIFCSKDVKALKAEVVKQGPSDHYPVTAVLRLEPVDLGLSPRVVEDAQLALAARGFLPGSVDGRMNPGTRRAIARVSGEKQADDRREPVPADCEKPAQAALGLKASKDIFPGA